MWWHIPRISALGRQRQEDEDHPWRTGGVAQLTKCLPSIACTWSSAPSSAPHKAESDGAHLTPAIPETGKHRKEDQEFKIMATQKLGGQPALHEHLSQRNNNKKHIERCA